MNLIGFKCLICGPSSLPSANSWLQSLLSGVCTYLFATLLHLKEEPSYLLIPSFQPIPPVTHLSSCTPAVATKLPYLAPPHCPDPFLITVVSIQHSRCIHSNGHYTCYTIFPEAEIVRSLSQAAFECGIFFFIIIIINQPSILFSVELTLVSGNLGFKLLVRTPMTHCHLTSL